jgi:hypothetical protein
VALRTVIGGRLLDQASEQRLAAFVPVIQLLTAAVVAPEDWSDAVPDKPEHVRLAAGAVAHQRPHDGQRVRRNVATSALQWLVSSHHRASNYSTRRRSASRFQSFRKQFGLTA